MKERTRFAAVVGMAALLTVPALGGAQGTPTRPVVSPMMYTTPLVLDSTRKDTAAVNALIRMGNYLRTLNVFEVKGTFSKEEVLTDGQKVQFAGNMSLLAERPRNLMAEMSDDRIQRIFLFNGQDFTLWSPRSKYYATVAVPGTIQQLVDTLDDRFALETPLVDLFRWGTSSSAEKDLTGAKDIGQSVIDGTTTQHYAFRQPGLDWEIWIQSGDYPLPRKIVINTLTDDARPQYRAQYNWNLAPSFSDDAFTFVPPDGAMKIKLMDLKNAAGAAKGKGGK